MPHDKLPLELEISPLRTTEMSPSEAMDLEQQAIAMLRFVAGAGLARREVLTFLAQLPQD